MEGQKLSMEKCTNLHRISISPWGLLLLLYVPFGLLLFVFRICLTLQGLLIFLLIPRSAFQRILLRLYFMVMGVLVTPTHVQRRNPSARMIISNCVSKIDHIFFQLAMNCSTSSFGGYKPLLSNMFDHHVFKAKLSRDISEELSHIPEFDDTISIPDSAAIPLIAQPEMEATNGTCLLNFKEWPFTATDLVQPVGITWWRPFNIPLTTLGSSDWSDFFWMLFSPITFVKITFLPAIELENDSPSEKYAITVQEKLATQMNLICSQATSEDVLKWKEECSMPVQNSSTAPPRVSTGPIISEYEYSCALAQPEIERMANQVLMVLPHVPFSIVKQDLLKTRSVDVTLTNILEGRLPIIEIQRTTQNKTRPEENVSLKQCQKTFEERKQDLLQKARRRYIERHGL